MAGIKLTLEEARKNPANFLYVFAKFKVNGKWYLEYIDEKHRNIILGKRGNQMLILANSARAYLGDAAKYEDYVNEIRAGFKEIYGIEPEDALLRLAAGEEVAGKNWDKGVYGVGASAQEQYPTTFENRTTSDGATIIVDSATGHIYADGKDLTDESKTVYGKAGGQTIAMQLFYTDEDETTYMSQYDKKKKIYYAKSYSYGGMSYSASNGEAVSASDGASIWGNINLSWDTILNWISSLLNALLGLNISPISSDGTNINTISAANTLPNQTTDGYAVGEAGLSTWATALLIAAAAGTFVVGGMGNKKK